MKKEVVGKDADNKELKVFVKSPNAKQMDLAQIEYGKAFGSAVTNGCLLKRQAGNVLRERGLWGDSQQKRLEELSNRIRENVQNGYSSAGLNMIVFFFFPSMIQDKI